MDISQEFKNETDKLLWLLATPSEETLNMVPLQGGWSAAQVGDHLFRSYQIEDLLQGKKAEAHRPDDEKFQELQSIFLDFEAKYQSPVEILPSEGIIGKDVLLASLQERVANILQASKGNDLGKRCMESEFPGIGFMTGQEWIYFSTVHTLRHNRQIENILKNI